jgi:hypothetical protein
VIFYSRRLTIEKRLKLARKFRNLTCLLTLLIEFYGIPTRIYDIPADYKPPTSDSLEIKASRRRYAIIAWLKSCIVLKTIYKQRPYKDNEPTLFVLTDRLRKKFCEQRLPSFRDHVWGFP